MLTADFPKFTHYAAKVRAGGRLRYAKLIMVKFEEAVEFFVMKGY
jgi:hypothetical protein